MTTSNVIDTTHHNAHEKSPEEIQLEIARTRSAITEDLLALSEKLSPQHLREGAREVMRDAREEAKEIMREAKDAAIGSLRDMKDRAVETVQEKVSVLGTQAKHAGSLTASFVSANAVALSLFGLGTGWLLMALRNRRRQDTGEYGYRYEHYDYPGEPQREGRRSAGDQVRSVASRASQAVDGAREQVRSSTSSLASQAANLAHRANGRARQAAGRTREVASDNRLAVVALTVAAGVGLGLLLPVAQRPRRALLGAGGRLWDEAQALGRKAEARARQTFSSAPEPAPARFELY